MQLHSPLHFPGSNRGFLRVESYMHTVDGLEIRYINSPVEVGSFSPSFTKVYMYIFIYRYIYIIYIYQPVVGNGTSEAFSPYA